MPKVSPLQGNFSAGELSPLVHGRVDVDRYKAGLETCFNYIPTIQGGLTRRPGTEYIAEVKSSTSKGRLIPFQYSTLQAYILVFCYGKIRFYKDLGEIQTGGSAYEIAMPYAEDELADLRFAQSADVLYIVHKRWAPRKLVRRGTYDWSLYVLDLKDGPYKSINNSGLTMTNIGTVGTISIVAGPTKTVTGAVNNGAGLARLTVVAHGYYDNLIVSIGSVGGVTGVNSSYQTLAIINQDVVDLNGTTFGGTYTSGGTVVVRPFINTDGSDASGGGDSIGRLIRIKQGSTWSYAKIKSAAGGSVTALAQSTFAGTAASTSWRFGAFSSLDPADTTTITTEVYEFPTIVIFHEDRLWFGGVPTSPQTFYGSCTSDYENFAPTAADGSVASNNAVTFTLNDNDVNGIRWALSDEKGLLAGTQSSEWVIKSASTTEAISPTSITAKKAANFGSDLVAPIQAAKAAIYVQRSGKKVREFNYFFDSDGFRSTDLSLLSEHISLDGITQMAFQREPIPVVWMVRGDGALLGMTYDRDVDSLKVGWHRHEIAGASDAAGNIAAVESIACIPSPDGTRDDLWMIVKRYINGGTKRYIEVMSPIFDDSVAQQDAFFLDCGLTLDSPKTVTAITKASPGVVSSTSHGFSNGDYIKFSDVVGMTEVNDNVYVVASAATNTFALNDSSGNAIATTAFTTFISGYCRKMVTAISGLSHLEGQVVSILADGAPQPSKTVASGAITLDTRAAVVHVGLGYNSDGKMLRIEAGAADGTALGKTKRTNRVGFLVHRTLGLKVGPDFDNLESLNFNTAADPLGHAPALFSGIIETTFDSNYDFENRICFRQSQPLPSTVLAIFPQMTTQDR